MIQKIRFSGAVLLLVFSLSVAVSAVPETNERTKTLTFVSFPDPMINVITSTIKEVGDVYMKQNQEVNIEIKTGFSRKQARKKVLDGTADGMMISDFMKELRHQADNVQKHGEQLELTSFTPLARRVIRHKEKVLQQVKIGLLTNRTSPELRKFSDFFTSPEAKKAIGNVKFMEPLE